VPLHRSDPLQDLLNLQERMNRLFEASLDRGRMEDSFTLSGYWVPLADVYETGETFVVEIELPGMEQDDIEIQVDGDTLAVKGERRGGGTRPESFHRMERSYGFFSRTFQLGEEVDPARVTATFRDGLLRLEAPKARARPGGRGGLD
jgi:HSP20 family protein